MTLAAKKLTADDVLAKVRPANTADTTHRDLASARHSLDALLSLDRQPTPNELAAVLRLVGSAQESVTPPIEAFNWIDAVSLAEALPPVPWVLEALQLGPGRPCSLQSYGAGMKSLTAASIGVALSAGVSVFGQFRCPHPKRVRIWDYEMGRRAWARRLQRTAFGYGVDLATLPIEVAALPKMKLTDAGARDAFMRGAEGIDLGIVDSFRAAARGADENDSSVREYLDLLLEVSEQTGITWLVLHHCGKAKDGHRDARQKGRGASAIFDAWGAVLDLEKDSETCRKVEMTKPHPEAAGPIEPFYLEVVDIPNGSNPNAGVVVRYNTTEQVHPPRERERELERDLARLVEVVAKSGPGGIGGADTIALKLGIKAQRCRSLVRLAVDQGDLVNVATLKNGTTDDRHPRYVTRPVHSSP